MQEHTQTQGNESNESPKIKPESSLRTHCMCGLPLGYGMVVYKHLYAPAIDRNGFPSFRAGMIQAYVKIHTCSCGRVRHRVLETKQSYEQEDL